tara:strand:- start:4406 stop:4675 length:270 start_codon:yes stop_codon:yes gene_type:complete
MGSFSPTIANNPTSENMGKGAQSPTSQPPMQFQGKNGMSTNSATSGQPQMGNPQDQEDMYQPQRRFPNTIQPWDNSQIQTQSNSGKGKG